jgi:hypothetical protein
MTPPSPQAKTFSRGEGAERSEAEEEFGRYRKSKVSV